MNQVLYHYDGEFHPLLTLGSGRDGSYAGLCSSQTEPGVMLVSFYSDHARMKTPLQGKANDIWVSRIKIYEK